MTGLQSSTLTSQATVQASTLLALPFQASTLRASPFQASTVQVSTSQKSRSACDSIGAIMLFFFTALLLSGCAQIRLMTYPPEFTYLDTASVKSTMHEIARSVTQLDELARKSEQSQMPAHYQDKILSRLQNLESLAVAISPGSTAVETGGLATNHLLIDEHIDDFIGQIMRARQLA